MSPLGFETETSHQPFQPFTNWFRPQGLGLSMHFNFTITKQCFSIVFAARTPLPKPWYAHTWNGVIVRTLSKGIKIKWSILGRFLSSFETRHQQRNSWIQATPCIPSSNEQVSNFQWCLQGANRIIRFIYIFWHWAKLVKKFLQTQPKLSNPNQPDGRNW